MLRQRMRLQRSLPALRLLYGAVLPRVLRREKGDDSQVRLYLQVDMPSARNAGLWRLLLQSVRKQQW
jgi:hypothetical protein